MSGLDIVDGNAKIIHALMTQVCLITVLCGCMTHHSLIPASVASLLRSLLRVQMMRYHTIKILSEVSDGFELTDDDILQWANGQVTAECGGGATAARLCIKNFSDPTLSSGHFLLHLLNSVRGIVNWSNVNNGLNDTEKLNNAQYIIRCVCVVCGDCVFEMPVTRLCVHCSFTVLQRCA